MVAALKKIINNAEVLEDVPDVVEEVVKCDISKVKATIINYESSVPKYKDVI